MDTLPNVNTRRGGENPSSAGLTSCALPEAQGAPGAARCSEGESSNFIPKDRPQWFVLRATYGRWKKAVDLLEDNDIETYVPMHDITKLINGKRRTFHEPLLPDIVFARLSRTMAEQFVKDPAPSSKWLKYYTDKTKPLENATGLNPPIVIPDNEMLNFIKATSVPSAHSGMDIQGPRPLQEWRSRPNHSGRLQRNHRQSGESGRATAHRHRTGGHWNIYYRLYTQ